MARPASAAAPPPGASKADLGGWSDRLASIRNNMESSIEQMRCELSSELFEDDDDDEVPSDEPKLIASSADGAMATVARTYGRVAWVVNPVRETYAVSETRKPPAAGEPDWRRLPAGDAYCAAAYTTLGRHLLAGEERLAVVRDGGDVVVHILSASRGNGFFGALVFPFVGPMQRKFFDVQLDAVEAAALGR